MSSSEKHYCKDPDKFPLSKFHQRGLGKGKQILIVGESPAENGWRNSGRAFYNPEGKILATGKKLNLLLTDFGLSVETCGFTELAKCYVGKNRKILSSCSEGCWPIFLKQLTTEDYKLIILLGVQTLKIFNQLSSLNLEIGKLSKATLDGIKYSFLPIYHPSPRNPYSFNKNQLIFGKQDIIQLFN